jgi:hypothetical protein
MTAMQRQDMHPHSPLWFIAVGLTVTDDEGATGTTTCTVTVLPAPGGPARGQSPPGVHVF